MADTIRIDDTAIATVLTMAGEKYLDIEFDRSGHFIFPNTSNVHNTVKLYMDQYFNLRQELEKVIDHAKYKEALANNPLADVKSEFKRSTRKIKGAARKGPDGVFR